MSRVLSTRVLLSPFVATERFFSETCTDSSLCVCARLFRWRGIGSVTRGEGKTRIGHRRLIFMSVRVGRVYAPWSQSLANRVVSLFGRVPLNRGVSLLRGTCSQWEKALFTLAGENWKLSRRLFAEETDEKVITFPRDGNFCKIIYYLVLCWFGVWWIRK